MTKRGQFFLMAGLVIITVIIELGMIYNSAPIKKPETKISYLANEIKYESIQVVDNAVYQKDNSGNSEYPKIQNNLNTLADYYGQSNPESEILIIYEKKDNQGSDPQFSTIYYNKSTPQNFEERNIDDRPGNNYIIVTFGDQDHKFYKTLGHDVFVIVKKETTQNNEKFIATA